MATLLMCLALPARAQDIRIVTEEFPPYNYSDNGLAKGLSSEVVQAVLAETGLTAEFLFLPWARAYLTAQNTKNTVIFSIGRIPEREDLFEWIGVIAPYNTSLCKLASRTDLTIESLSDAKDYSIGVSVEDVIYQYLKSQNFTNLDIVGEDILNIRKLALSRLDLIAFDEAAFQYYLDLEDINPALFDRIYRLDDISGGLYMAINKDSDPELIQSLKGGLEAIKADGTYEQILNRHRVMN
ncbi:MULTISPECIES: ABC transporter substrate-binding protein [unclassified Roseibium]|uniref:substrate-binding periplasmic protein n=1 Tax=unclassified Roseibium TaxID=2629323 RepID=UPI00273F81D9|nr:MULTISPECIES: transporter substrate-binding domain-containing protein [unclassified Roseibium]